MSNKNDDYHLGRIILEKTKKYEDDIQQIEVITGAKETHGSVRLRSIRMAQTFKAAGIKPDDVIMISAVNHNDSTIPLIASLLYGTIPMPITVDMKYLEIKHFLIKGQPKMIFADPDAAVNIKKVVEELGMNSKIVVFGKDEGNGFVPFENYIRPTGNEENFQCEDINPMKKIALLSCSSGSTGLPKLVELSHFGLYYAFYAPRKNATEQERLEGIYLNFSPLYWISGSSSVIMANLIGNKVLKSIEPYSPEIFRKAAELYKPSVAMFSQIALVRLIEYLKTNETVFPSFRMIFSGGSKVNDDLLDKLQMYVPNAIILGAYGCTEVLSISISMTPKRGSCGKINPMLKWKLVDPETGKEMGVNEPGEMRVQSPMTFLGYYNDPKATDEAFDEDGWYKTGDLLYYDDDGYFYFVDRIKELIKYRNYQVSVAEMESAINDIPGVMGSGVIGVPNFEDGQHPMAYIQLTPDSKLTVEEINDYLRENMSDSKQLRGGVVFVDNLPMTYSGKVNRKALKEMSGKF